LPHEGVNAAFVPRGIPNRKTAPCQSEAAIERRGESFMNLPTMLFTPYALKGLTLKNRITMAPMYVGYANRDGTVSSLTIEHYRDMAASGAAMIAVENAAVDPSGIISPNTLRIDSEKHHLIGLAQLAQTIHKEGALAFLQINHAGRYAHISEPLAPSPIKTGDVIPLEMTENSIDRVVQAFAVAARRVREAGFDGLEIHGGTGYLMVQFLSPRTNQRKDRYGGSIENRMRFPLRVVDAILDAVGKDYPVGYRFLADEWLPDGLHPEETLIYAAELEKRGIAYLSVTAGTYDSFYDSKFKKWEKGEAYMSDFAASIRGAVPNTPIIMAGRMQNPQTADEVLQRGCADLIGLARVLFADPLWPQKAAGIDESPVIECDRSCSLCTKRAMLGLPAFCARWDKDHRQAFMEKIKEDDEGIEELWLKATHLN
jgi:2,4-dienoyl-CoA reductase (NADPH2)